VSTQTGRSAGDGTGDNQTTTIRKERVSGIPGVRLVAATLVFISHASTLLDEHGYAEDFFTARGAWLFFVLSGFLLPASAPRQLAKIPAYFRKRAARIYPLYLAVFAVMLVPAVLGVGIGDFTVTWQSLLSNATLTQEWLTGDLWRSNLNPPTWSLSVEVFSWLVIPAVYLLQQRFLPAPTRRQAAILLVLASAFVMAGGLFPGPRAMRELPFFLVGIELRHLMHHGLRTRRPLVVGLLAGLLVMSGGWALTNYEGSDLMFGWARAASAIGFCLVIVAITSTRSTGILQSRAAERLGGWSYAFFLVQTAMLGITGRLVLAAQPSDLVAYFAVTVCFAATWIVAGICNRLVEQPFTKLLSTKR